MKKAVAAVLLAVLLVCAVFSSCGKKEDGAVTGNGNTTRSAAQNAVTNAGDAVGDAVTGAGDVVGDVVTGAADTNDLYSYNIFRAYFGFEIHFVSSSTVI